jgi:hypothetical protein
MSIAWRAVVCDVGQIRAGGANVVVFGETRGRENQTAFGDGFDGSGSRAHRAQPAKQTLVACRCVGAVSARHEQHIETDAIACIDAIRPHPRRRRTGYAAAFHREKLYFVRGVVAAVSGGDFVGRVEHLGDDACAQQTESIEQQDADAASCTTHVHVGCVQPGNPRSINGHMRHDLPLPCHTLWAESSDFLAF